MYKVVIDTNLLIDGSQDAYNFGNRIIDSVIAGHIEAWANRETIRENKFIAPQKIKDPNYLNKLTYFFEQVKIVENSPRLEVVAEDPEDNKLLGAAVAAHANFLITSDHHLLKLEKYEGVKIIPPAQFWNIYQDEGEGWLKWVRDFIR